MVNQSPEKKTKLENQSVTVETENLEKENKPLNASEATSVGSNKQKKKDKKMRKGKQQSIENGEIPVSQSFTNGDVGMNSTVNESLNETVEVENDNEMKEQMPKSDKKKKRKSKMSLSSDNANEVIAETEGPVSAPQSAKKAKLNLATGIENQSTGSDVSILNQSKNEPGSGKKKKKQK